MKECLIVGLGIGNLYNTVINGIDNCRTITVDSDPNKNADFLTVDDAINKCRAFNTAHICTPNFTHLELARKLAPVTDIVFVEKPGVANSAEWGSLVKEFPKTRFMMVKNNMWRDNINELKDAANKAVSVSLLWLNKDRVPNPGTWFTTKKLAFGGVSRDLMPHLLSLYIALNPNWRTDEMLTRNHSINWKLSELTNTDYGIVKSDGIYNVDDLCYMTFADKWCLSTNWKTCIADMRQINFTMPDGSVEEFHLGLCPEYAYRDMIKDAIDNRLNDEFWQKQFEYDMWIHKQIEDI